MSNIVDDSFLTTLEIEMNPYTDKHKSQDWYELNTKDFKTTIQVCVTLTKDEIYITGRSRDQNKEFG